MKSYNGLLYDAVNSGNFVRSFYGVCPECRRRIWSIGEKHNEGLSIQALFKCSCGKKYKEKETAAVSFSILLFAV